jgi:hypothetical protein
MKTSNFVRIGCAAAFTLACCCHKGEKRVVAVGSDTIRVETIRAIMPLDSVNDSAALRQGAFRFLLDKSVSSGERQPDSTAAKFGKRMELLSGKQWSPQAAAALLNAGVGLTEKLSGTASAAAATALVDSLTALAGKRIGDRDRAALAAMDPADPKFRVRLYAAAFGISEEEAATLANFIGKDQRIAAGNIDAMVKGLLAVPGTGRVAERAVVERVPAEHPGLALKFRPQESIRDSIGKRLPDLQQIYKRHLKMNEATGGVVWVVFRVDAAGKVVKAAIKSSEIDNKVFLMQLRDYAGTIRFKKIPDTVGAMTFEFPFEFKPEL